LIWAKFNAVLCFKNFLRCLILQLKEDHGFVGTNKVLSDDNLSALTKHQVVFEIGCNVIHLIS